MNFLSKAGISAYLTPINLDNLVLLFVAHRKTCNEGSEVVESLIVICHSDNSSGEVSSLVADQIIKVEASVAMKDH